MPNVQSLARKGLPEFEEVFDMVEAEMGFLPTSLLTMGRVLEILGGFLAPRVRIHRRLELCARTL